VATFVLIHGAADVAWYWHLTAEELRARGHDVVAMDLPCEDESAGWSEYADTVVEAIGDRTELVVVGQSLGAVTAALVCSRVPAELLVLVAGMIPLPGEPVTEWFSNPDYAEAARGPDYGDDEVAIFLHDVPPALAAEALEKGRGQAEKPMVEPWPLDAWPDVPTRVLLCRGDRMFPAAFQRRVARERLGIEPDEMDGGHYIALSRPRELAERLVGYRAEL